MGASRLGHLGDSANPAKWIVEDCAVAAVLTFGTSIFKISRLFTIALIVVRLFSCDYYRVKKETAVPVDFDSYFTSMDPATATSRQGTWVQRWLRAASPLPSHAAVTLPPAAPLMIRA